MFLPEVDIYIYIYIFDGKKFLFNIVKITLTDIIGKMKYRICFFNRE